MNARKAFQHGFFDGIEGFKPKEKKNHIISISENLTLVYPLELQKYEQGHVLGKWLHDKYYFPKP